MRIEFQPAEADTGIVFLRRDLTPAVRIPARVDHRVETPRRTTLRSGAVTVEMVEHILAALGGLEIDNCEVHVDAPEMPGCDGSARPFVEALDAAGIVVQPAARRQLLVTQPLRVGDDVSWVEMRPPSGRGLAMTFELDYGKDNPIGRQKLSLRLSPEEFRRELAASRTFMLRAEAEWIRGQGLGLRTTLADLLVFDADGPMENTLRYPDECVRHKMLDLLGDLSLAGCQLVGDVVAHRSGHRLNAELVRQLLARASGATPYKRSA